MASKLALLGGEKTVIAAYPSYPIIGAEEMTSVVKVLMSGQLSTARREGIVAEMEEGFAKYFHTKYALSFTSGTSTIHGALFAVGVRPGTEVLTSNNTWMSAITAIMHAGGTPVFCDIKPGTLHIDPKEIRKKAGPNTRAIVVTHIWGIPADMDPILKVAGELKLAVIEDCAHAHGAKYKGRFVGTLGDVGCFSLQASKPIIAGEGGILITNHKRYYQRAMIPGHHGQRLTDELTLADLRPFAAAGGYWKYRIPPLSAAVAVAQLGRLDQLTAARQSNFDMLQAGLAKTVPFISWPKLAPGSKRGWYHTPTCYNYDQAKVPCELFLRACQAEGVRVGGSGYPNWYQVPLLQDTKLYSQLWPVKHGNGVEYKPLPAGALPHDEALRRRIVIFGVPAIESPELIKQTAAAVEKVAANMANLARYHRSTKVD